jgi:hypothetical protein
MPRPKKDCPTLFPRLPCDPTPPGRGLDYLGFEQNTLKPLLVVEAKRLKAPLPFLATLLAPGASAAAAIPVDPIGGRSAIVSRGLVGEKLTGDWNRWLAELKDYIRSIHTKTKQVPKRVVMTNGEWLILFRDPTAFLSDAACPPEDILVYGDADAIGTGLPISRVGQEQCRGSRRATGPHHRFQCEGTVFFSFGRNASLHPWKRAPCEVERNHCGEQGALRSA